MKLGEDGWKKRYYTQKFGDELYEEGFTKRLWGEYTKGLCWVLAYYYKGCASWSWYYPFRVSPIPSDMYLVLKRFVKDINKLTLNRKLRKLMAYRAWLWSKNHSYYNKAFLPLLKKISKA